MKSAFGSAESPLAAGAARGDHVLVLLVGDGAVGLDGEHAERAVGRGHARGPRHRGVQALVDERLHHGVHRRAVALAQRAGTVAPAELRAVPVRGDDPAVPAQLAEAQAEVVQPALVLGEHQLLQVLAQVVG